MMLSYNLRKGRWRLQFNRLKVQLNQTYSSSKWVQWDNSFMNKVSYLAKCLFQSIMAFIISKIMHSFSIQRFMQKSIPNAIRSLTIKVHNLPIKPTNIFTHVPNSCSFSSNYCIFIQSTRSNHRNSLNSCH